MCKDVLNELYKVKILERDFTSIDDYFGAWGEVELEFMDKVQSKQKYQVWVEFAQ